MPDIKEKISRTEKIFATFNISFSTLEKRKPRPVIMLTVLNEIISHVKNKIRSVCRVTCNSNLALGEFFMNSGLSGLTSTNEAFFQSPYKGP
jgi:hypothetical protein